MIRSTYSGAGSWVKAAWLRPMLGVWFQLLGVVHPALYVFEATRNQWFPLILLSQKILKPKPLVEFWWNILSVQINPLRLQAQIEHRAEISSSEPGSEACGWPGRFF